MKDKLSYPPSSVRWLRFSPTELLDSVASSLTEILIQGTLLSGYLAYWKNLAELSLLGEGWVLIFLTGSLLRGVSLG